MLFFSVGASLCFLGEAGIASAEDENIDELVGQHRERIPKMLGRP